MNTDFAQGYTAGVATSIAIVVFGSVLSAFESADLEPGQAKNICAGLWGCGAPPLLDVIGIALVLLVILVALWMAAYGPRLSTR